MPLLRSNVEFSKRVFLDRLTTDAQPLLQPADIDEGPGDEYDYGGVGDAGNFGAGFDCSGLDGVVLAIALNGPNYFPSGYQRLFSTETFPGPLAGFRQTNQGDCLNGDYPLKVFIHHGGGGPNSHMACQIDGWWMESNGGYGVCTERPEITPPESNYWNDWWVYDGPIAEDTTWRQSMSYPRGFDYAGGRPTAAQILAAGGEFVCRYLSDGGSGLPGKQLQPAEFTDLISNGIQVVFNWETTADFMLGGAQAGNADATTALNYVRSLPGMGSANPVVFFSCDFDAAPDQQDAINAYLTAAAQVLGGPQFVGIYGAYYVGGRALDAGVCKYLWQTEAWSGGNIDARVNIMQRNGLGYANVGGVQCDINEAHTTDFGQWQITTPDNPPAPNDPTPTPGGIVSDLTQAQQEDIYNMLLLSYQQLVGGIPNVEQYLLPGSPTPTAPGGWSQLGQNQAGLNLTPVDAIADIKNQVFGLTRPDTESTKEK